MHPLLPQRQGRRGFIIRHSIRSRIQFKQAMNQGPCSQRVFEGIGPLPTAPDDGKRVWLVLMQALGHRFTVGQCGGHQQRNITDPIKGTGSIGGAHEQALTSDGFRANGHGGVPQIKPFQFLATPLTHQQACICRPSRGGGLESFDISKGLDGLCPVVESPGDGGGGTQHINHHRSTGMNALGHLSWHVEVRNLHGHAVEQRATQYRDRSRRFCPPHGSVPVRPGNA